MGLPTKKNEQLGKTEELTKEMTLEEAKAYRKSLHKPANVQLSVEEKRNHFRMWWAEQKSKYGKGKDLEHVLWLHLKAIDMTSPEQFEQGMKNFGLQIK